MTEETAPPPSEATTEAAPVSTPAAKSPRDGKVSPILMGTAVGIGSAAIVAALMYTRRKK